MRSVTITIDLDALRYNLSRVRKLAPQQKIFSVLKSNAYGHGLIQCAKALTDTDGFAVVTPGEAYTLRAAGIKHPVLVIQGAQQPQDLFKSSASDIALGLHSMHQVEMLEQHSTSLGGDTLKVWVKIDTGMGRLGFLPDQLAEVLSRLSVFSQVNVVGCLTHFSSADEPENPATPNQINLFTEITEALPFKKSMANSAGIIVWPESRKGWLRPGIMLYGANPVGELLTEALKPVMTVKAPIVAVRRIPAGGSIGYGRTFVSDRERTVVVVGIGYGDGYPRHMADGAVALVNGVRCKLLGRVSMDSIVLDLPDTLEAKPGDEVILWGDGLRVEEIAEKAGTISYELLCQIRGEFHYVSV